MTDSKNTVVLLNFLPSFDSSYSGKGTIYPAIAILLIGSMLKKNGFNVKIIDGAYDESYIETLKKYVEHYREQILYVGMSVMTTQVPLALEASKFIKKIDSQIPVVWGGAHPSLFPEQTLRDKNVDIVAINEGAETAVKIAEIIQSRGAFSSINGIGFKEDDQNIKIRPSAMVENIHSLPHFDFSLIDIENYLGDKISVYQREFPGFKSKIKIMPILTGLGCPYKCQFCINVILKRRYRYRDAKSIVTEIERLQSQHDVNTFIFMDEDFFINKKRAYEFLDLVEEKNLHFNWRMWCRVDHFQDNYINRQFLVRLENIGYGSLVMGGESGNQDILDQLKKQITTEQIIHSLKMLKGLRITPRYSFIVGLENESIDHIKNTLKFCFQMKTIRPDVDIASFVFRLYPGSPIYNRLTEKYNIETPTDPESWCAYLSKSDSYTQMPWTPALFEENIKLIEFCMGFSIPAQSFRLSIKNILIKILSFICRYRLKTFNFKFPIEYKLWQWFLSLR